MPHNNTSEIWVLLNLTHRHLTHTFETALRQAGLPNARWYQVLWMLERDGKDQGLRQFELEQGGLLDQPNLSRTLKKMTEMGLVTTVKAKDDGRGRVLCITSEGCDLRARMWDIYGALMISNIEERLEADEASQFLATLNKLMPDDWER
jgi:DNA-binding MarR family transcriptional regulator